jgi:hypothetical protein
MRKKTLRYLLCVNISRQLSNVGGFVSVSYVYPVFLPKIKESRYSWKIVKIALIYELLHFMLTKIIKQFPLICHFWYLFKQEVT